MTQPTSLHLDGERTRLAHAVAADLFAAEAAIDAAVTAVAHLTATLPHVRTGLGLSAVVGGEAFERLSASLCALVTAQGQTASAHDTLARMQVRAGLGSLRMAGGDKTPDPMPMPAGHGEHGVTAQNAPGVAVRSLRRA